MQSLILLEFFQSFIPWHFSGMLSRNNCRSIWKEFFNSSSFFFSKNLSSRNFLSDSLKNSQDYGSQKFQQYFLLYLEELYKKFVQAFLIWYLQELFQRLLEFHQEISSGFSVRNFDRDFIENYSSNFLNFFFESFPEILYQEPLQTQEIP